MKTIGLTYVVLCFLGSALAWADGADRMRELEAVEVESNVVEKASRSTGTLKEFLTDVKTDADRRLREDMKIADSSKQDKALDKSRAAAEVRSKEIRNQGGEQAQRVMQQTTQRVLAAEDVMSFDNLFITSLSYWMEEGFYNAGFQGGWAIGNQAFGDIPYRTFYAPHHGRIDRTGDAE